MPKSNFRDRVWVFDGKQHTEGLVESLNALFAGQSLLRTEFKTEDMPNEFLRSGWSALREPVFIEGQELHIPVGLRIVVPLRARRPGRFAALDITGNHVAIRIPIELYGRAHEHHYGITAVHEL